jgi:tRNA pseudouridine38-40 synthase
MVQRLKLELAYYGRPFHGWQKQRGQRTVQGELEKALASVFRSGRVQVVGAGRTDAGVHAAGQVVHLGAPGPIPPEALVRSLNGRLPLEIRILSARLVSDTFHARKSAVGKLYTYRARWHAPKLPWLETRSATVPGITDWEGLREALGMLPGRRDWASFTVPEPGKVSTIRTLFQVRCHSRRDGFDLDFLGDGFLRYQVRRLVGALFEVGRGERRVDDLRNLLDHPRPGAPIHTAPATGLCLEHVYYRRCPALTLNASEDSRRTSL